MQETLYKALLDYKSLGRSSFHTPGHKNNFYSKIELLSLDYTELPMTDSLYEANGAIKASEEKVEKMLQYAADKLGEIVTELLNFDY